MYVSQTFLDHADAVFEAVQLVTDVTPGVAGVQSGNLLAMTYSDGHRSTLNRQDSIEQIWFADGPMSWQFERDPVSGDWMDTLGRGALLDVVGATLEQNLGLWKASVWGGR